jgi:VanZ family protein
MGLFGLLAMLFMAPVYASELPLKKKYIYIVIIAMAVSLWGLVTEYIQDSFIEGRSFDIYDWVADTCGSIISIFLAKYIFLNPPSFKS